MLNVYILRVPCSIRHFSRYHHAYLRGVSYELVYSLDFWSFIQEVMYFYYYMYLVYVLLCLNVPTVVAVFFMRRVFHVYVTKWYA